MDRASVHGAARALLAGRPGAGQMTVAVFTQIYEYEGKRYEVLGLAKLKHPETRAWLPAVVYRPESIAGENFIRLASEFFARFKLVGPKHLPNGASMNPE